MVSNSFINILSFVIFALKQQFCLLLSTKFTIKSAKQQIIFRKAKSVLITTIENRQMILKNTYEVQLNKEYKRIHFLHAAYNDTFVFLATLSGKKDGVVHLDQKGKVLFEALFQDQMMSMGLLSEKQVIFIETRNNRISILNLQTHQFTYFPHYFMFVQSDQSDIITFSQTKYLCIEQRGRYNQNRYKLTYYQYPLQLTQKKTPKTAAIYQSSQNEWTYEYLTKKANNYSMMMWYKPKPENFFQFKTYDIQNGKGFRNIYKFNQGIADQPDVNKIETLIRNAWEMKKNYFMFVCVTHNPDNKKTYGSIVNSNFVIDVFKKTIREAQFTFGHYQDYLIDQNNLGPNAMFRTFKIEQGQNLPSPTYYIDNQTQKLIAEEQWTMSHLYKYQFEGYASGLICEGLYENQNVNKFAVNLKRIVYPKDVYLFLLSEWGVQLENEFIADLLLVLS